MVALGSVTGSAATGGLTAFGVVSIAAIGTVVFAYRRLARRLPGARGHDRGPSEADVA